jgi:hypothetical protein
MDALILHKAIAEVCPIISARIGVESDRTTWSFDPDPSATQAQIDAGNNVIATIDINLTPVPSVITNRQFYQQLAVQSEITQQEALDAIRTGVIPARLAAAITTLPTDQQFSATMAVIGSPEFRRAHPTTQLLQTAMGWTSTQTDDLWRKASQL